MSINILMPSVGPGASEGKLLEWRKRLGEAVSIGEVIAEIETDKAVVELEALDAGVLDKVLVEAGSSGIQVGAVIGVLENGKAEFAPKQSLGTVKVATAQQTPSLTTSPTNLLQVHREASPTPPQSDRTHFASPSARRRARELSVNVSEVVGTGPKGRVVRIDVERFAENVGARAAVANDRPPRATPMRAPSSHVEPHTPIRRAIARRLLESKQSIPHFYLKVDCGVTKLQTVRASLNNKLTSSGTNEKITINDFIVFAVSRALVDVPEMNVRWTEDGTEVLDVVDVGVAVSKEGGLITPVVNGAGTRGLRDLSREIRRLTGVAKQGRLKLQELEGGSLTVTNLGMYGVDEFAAIINPPQSAIVAVGKVRDQLSLDSGGSVQVSKVMTLTLSADHRVVDGALGARFLASLKSFIETPALLLL
jgi:pyruvate dehydrogenase E2 component (dihydrolipoamide acetyltransferase)